MLSPVVIKNGVCPHSGCSSALIKRSLAAVWNKPYSLHLAKLQGWGSLHIITRNRPVQRSSLWRGGKTPCSVPYEDVDSIPAHEIKVFKDMFFILIFCPFFFTFSKFLPLFCPFFTFLYVCRSFKFFMSEMHVRSLLMQLNYLIGGGGEGERENLNKIPVNVTCTYDCRKCGNKKKMK